MIFKEGIGWKVCFDEERGIYTAERGGGGYYNLNELLGRWANDPYDHYKEMISETHKALKKARRIK